MKLDVVTFLVSNMTDVRKCFNKNGTGPLSLPKTVQPFAVLPLERDSLHQTFEQDSVIMLELVYWT